MMQWWADYLDELESNSGRVISIGGRGKPSCLYATGRVDFEPNVENSPNGETNIPRPKNLLIEHRQF